MNAIELTPDSTAIVYNLSWQDFEIILADLSDREALMRSADSRHTRLTYYQGTLEIISCDRLNLLKFLSGIETTHFLRRSHV